ncbi:aldehyde dehydrogenase family protein [Amycolatopsis magusensis]|uniref:aldehyde dehydrogenase (NAD(+)) n=1 Tax=Amycolatopsis magusensis TaxID=882444 RepID=A0ABS4PGP1_9PSEU|nr:aldehyde dehydrogenase family protein [Amycolatopsis magusensis]MBP2178578.1 acyl-CoA reductase-like NAD-dependent aldehyde dehydrogenase [Amycolatopsis magusensis]MDI5979354.1 aldehyde dehydrogenase family protein [Amycolatopsis magusensis]
MRDVIYVDGKWVASAAPETIDVVNPATEAVIDRVPAGSAADVDAAVAAARRAFDSWSATPAEQRCGYLGQLAAKLKERNRQIAEAITADMGAPVKIAQKVQAGLPAVVAASYSDPAVVPERGEEVGNSLIVREPIGVVGAITPWNYPLHQIVAKVAPALAAGCTVVLKPSEVAPLAAYLLTEILDEIGLPAGVFNLVSGTGPVVGEAIAAHPDIDMVSFTGSSRAGARVSEVAAGTVKRVALELGGKSPNVILPDADLATAVKAGLSNVYLNSGQTCTALTRMIVHRDQRDEVVGLLAEGAAKFSVGDPADPATKLGPLVSAAQRDRVRGYIQQGIEEGATLVAGGPDAPEGLDQGYYVRPTVFADVTPEMTIAQEEIFGPVLSVLTYETEDEAVAIANNTPYGLAAAVWAGDAEHATAVARRIRAGQVEVNGGAFNPLAPFGGYKQSGNGRELGRFGLEEFLETKAIQR